MRNAALVARSASLMLTGQLVARVMGLATFMLLTRHLAVGAVGAFGYATVLVGFLALGVDFGFDQVVTRDTAKSGDRGLAGLALRWKTGMFLVLFPLLLVIAQVLPAQGGATALVGILGTAVWLESLNRTISGVCLAHGRAEYGVFTEILTSCLRFLAVFAVTRAGYGIVAVCLAYLASSSAASLVMMMVAYSRGGRLVTAIVPGQFSWLFREAASFAVYGLLFQLYFRIDVVILSALRPASDVGQYVAAFRVIEALLVVPAALMGALYPVLSRLAGGEETRGFERAILTSVRLLTLAGAGLSLVVGLSSVQVIRIITGGGYSEGAGYLRLLVPAFALICVNCTGLIGLSAMGRQKENVPIMLAGAVTKTMWNVLLIPRLGVEAACAGTIVTELVVTAFVVTKFRVTIPVAMWIRAASGAAAASVATVIGAAVTLGLPDILRALTLVAVFATVAVLSKAVCASDLSTLAQLLRRRVSSPRGAV